MSERDNNVYKAKLAEQAERYDESSFAVPQNNPKRSTNVKQDKFVKSFSNYKIPKKEKMCNGRGRGNSETVAGEKNVEVTKNMDSTTTKITYKFSKIVIEREERMESSTSFDVKPERWNEMDSKYGNVRTYNIAQDSWNGNRDQYSNVSVKDKFSNSRSKNSEAQKSYRERENDESFYSESPRNYRDSYDNGESSRSYHYSNDRSKRFDFASEKYQETHSKKYESEKYSTRYNSPSESEDDYKGNSKKSRRATRWDTPKEEVYKQLNEFDEYFSKRQKTFWGGQESLDKYENYAKMNNQAAFVRPITPAIPKIEESWSSEDESQSQVEDFMSAPVISQEIAKIVDNWDNENEFPGYSYPMRSDDEVSRKERKRRFRLRADKDFEQNLKELFEDLISYDTRNPDIHKYNQAEWDNEDFGDPAVWLDKEPLPYWFLRFSNDADYLKLMGREAEIVNKEVQNTQQNLQMMVPIIHPFLCDMHPPMLVPPGLGMMVPRKTMAPPPPPPGLENEILSTPEDVSFYHYENTLITIPQAFDNLEAIKRNENESWDGENFGPELKWLTKYP